MLLSVRYNNVVVCFFNTERVSGGWMACYT